MTNQFVDVAVSALLSAGLVETDGKKSGKLGYSISADGIDWIQSGSQFDPNLPAVSDLWNEPDSIVLDNHSAVGQVRMHLSQCIVIIGLSQFTQEEKSQIVGLIRICEQIIDLPTPKVGLLRKVLGWLKDVKDIAPLVEFILKLTGKLP